MVLMFSRHFLSSFCYLAACAISVPHRGRLGTKIGIAVLRTVLRTVRQDWTRYLLPIKDRHGRRYCTYSTVLYLQYCTYSAVPTVLYPQYCRFMIIRRAKDCADVSSLSPIKSLLTVAGLLRRLRCVFAAHNQSLEPPCVSTSKGLNFWL